jgi:hypothetical protein
LLKLPSEDFANAKLAAIRQGDTVEEWIQGLIHMALQP